MNPAKFLTRASLSAIAAWMAVAACSSGGYGDPDKGPQPDPADTTYVDSVPRTDTVPPPESLLRR